MNTLITMLKRLLGFTALAALLATAPAHAEQFVAYGDYEIHYNAFNSSFVEPDVAQTYGLQRGKRRAFVNVSVLKKEADGSKRPVTAIVSGSAVNLLQQNQDMGFRKVDEGNAIYYIGQFGFSDDMLMRMNIQVQPDPNQPAYTLQFEQTFYAD